jgi:hypothetical protein
MDVFVEMSEDARGEEGRPGEITVSDLAGYFRTLKTTASAARPVKKTKETVKKATKKTTADRGGASKGGETKSSSGSRRDVTETIRRTTTFFPVALSYSDDSVKNAVERFTQRMRRGPRDGITFPEVLAEFSFLYESVTSDPTVASSFAKLRLHCKTSDVLSASEFVIDTINRALANPFDVKYWQIRQMNDVYQARVGQHLGGSDLMSSVGFHTSRHPRSGETILVLRRQTGNGNPVAAPGGSHSGNARGVSPYHPSTCGFIGTSAPLESNVCSRREVRRARIRLAV